MGPEVRDENGELLLGAPSGVRCPKCASRARGNGYDGGGWYRYRCDECKVTFRDPTGRRREVVKKVRELGSERVPVKRSGSEVLNAYRHVLENVELADRSGLERQARLLMVEDNKEFMKRYAVMEEEESERRRRRKEEKLKVEGVDPGEVRALALLKEMLEGRV